MTDKFEGKIAGTYAKFRPTYSDDIAKKVVEYATKNKADGNLRHLVDVGCGGGQSTEMFKPYFELITGVDVSESQIAEARKHPKSKIVYLVSSAEALPIEDKSVDVICSGIAAHCFDLPKFWRECRRVLKHDGSLVLFGYDLPSVALISESSCQSDQNSFQNISKDLITEFYQKVNLFKENLHALNQYAELFDMIPSREKHRGNNLKMERNWSLEQFGQFWSSSAVYQAYLTRRAQNGEPNQKLLRQLLDDIKQIYGFCGISDSEISAKVTWEVYMLFSTRPEPL